MSDERDQFELVYENKLKDATINGGVLDVVRERLEQDPDKPAGFEDGE